LFVFKQVSYTNSKEKERSKIFFSNMFIFEEMTKIRIDK
jgi:hypothetical protein